MAVVYIKSFSWIECEKILIKIESINSYLNTVTEKKTISLDDGELEIVCVEKSDMTFDTEHKQLCLCDNTDYWFSYSVNSPKLNTETIANILKRSIEGNGILNSGNYVGILDLEIEEFSVITKSKKANYDRDFEFLRKSITDFCDDLLSRSSSYYAEHFVKGEKYLGDKVNYSEIAYLKKMMAPDKFPAWIDYLIYHAEHTYIRNVEYQYLYETDEIEAEHYLDGLASKELIKTKKIQGNAGKYGLAPAVIKTYSNQVTYDTKENRFVKFFVHYLRDLLDDVILQVDNFNCKLKREIEKIREIIEIRIQHPFWKKISELDQIPFNSQILQKKYPYNMIYQMYTEFGVAAEINLGDLDKSYLIGQKDAPMLYQYWVFIMLFQYLANRFEDNYITSDWIKYDKSNLTFSLKEGRCDFAKFFVGENKEIHLLYNKTYDNKHAIWAGRSYSHELKPDISLELFEEGNLVAILHFDAKYRLPLNGTDVPDDINKMHAYKDGIMGTVGAFAICLADEMIIYHEEELGIKNESLFPSVGACPLNLNPKDLETELDNIMYIVDEFSKIEIHENKNSFSGKRMESYCALTRKMMKVEERNV